MKPVILVQMSLILTNPISCYLPYILLMQSWYNFRNTLCMIKNYIL